MIGVEARPTHLGVRTPRVEDERLLRGRGTYVADVRVPEMLDVAIARSQFAHARFEVDLERARTSQGVVAAVSAADLSDVAPIPDFFPFAQPVREFPLQRDRARYVGAPLAAIVASDRYRAEDALERVDVRYDELPTVTTIEDALRPDAPRLFDDWRDDRVIDSPAEDDGTDAAFAAAARTVSGRYTIQRHTAVPMETRGVVARFEDGRLTVWTSSQIPHVLRTLLSYVLPIAESDVRVIAPDVGGGFGSKAQVYPEEFLLGWLAMHLRRPVRYVEDRFEHLIASSHARDQVIELAAATGEDGKILAIRGRVVQDVGSGEIYPCGFNPAQVTAGALTQGYDIAHQKVDVTSVVTNKTPSGAYRGFGNPEAQFAIERLVDASARAAGVDPVGLRRSMLLRPEQLPYRTPTGALLDSGSHLEAYDLALAEGRRALEDARARLQRGAVRVGLGVTPYVEGTTPSYFGNTGHWGGQESVAVAFDPDGGVTVTSGTSTTGQGVKTVLATLAAELLGVRIDQVRVVIGDTDAAPYGLGGWASRSTVMTAGAMQKAAAPLRDKAIRIAAHLMEVAAEDVVVDDGTFHVVGSDEPSATWAQVATAALIRTMDLPAGLEPGLDAAATYVPPGIDHAPRADGRMNACATYTNAAVAAVVAVDVETGVVRVDRYVVVHDCGTVINPVVVEGQVHGGVAQGIGGAVMEELPYDAFGQPGATTFMDYLLPTAPDVPEMVVRHLESPSPFTALGVKGAGEAGIVGAPTAVAMAVEDALRPLDVEITEMPLRPDAVVRLIDEARQRDEVASGGPAG